MSRQVVPELATPRVMARTLAFFYAFGALAGVLGNAGRARDDAASAVLVVVSLLSLGLAVALLRRGSTWPRALLSGIVVGSAPLVGVAVVVVPDPATAVAAAALLTFVGVDVHLFFPPRAARAVLVGVVGTVTLALAVRGDVAPGAVLVVDVVVLAMGEVTRRMVRTASGASRDALTGLVNRRGLDDALQDLVARRQLLCVALLDLDHFKQVNDTAGHAAGDRLLCRVAAAWSRAAPAGAVLARHGGDEFALLLPGAPGEEALDLARRLVALVPGVGVSAGVAQRRDGESAAQLMRRADRALYAAKDAGRGRAALDGAAAPGRGAAAAPSVPVAPAAPRAPSLQP